uniref:Uncharacterized protein n=1 Tax=Panthera tigris altaica TaxID=74533 RepID=A0A8C9JNH8_PANTA
MHYPVSVRDFCCIASMKITLCSPSSPLPGCNRVACAVTGPRMAASPLHSHRTHAPPGWFWFFYLFSLWKVYSAERL